MAAAPDVSWKVSNYRSLCSWTGVQCDDTSTWVVSLDISNSNISGALSPAIMELGSLRNLSVCGNNLAGSFPPEIHKLSRLQYLNISNNQFNGSLNWEFHQLKELAVLDAYDNNFLGSLPVGVTQLPKLKHLDFGGNYFSGKIQETMEVWCSSLICHLQSWESWSICSSRPLKLWLEGPIPPELGNLKHLDTLFLQTNQLSGSIPPQLGNLSSLKSLDLSNNGLTGEIPLEFSELTELTLLQLFINKFHGEIPHFIAELPKLEVLKLWQNNFTGTIPSKLGRNGKLSELDLSTNKLTGLIPKSLCFGRRLKILILLNNFLFGPLPDDLGRCETLQRVRLGQNYLSGFIPNGFLYLPQLSLMELQNNYLTGGFPEESSKVPSKVGQLNLSNNRLSGSLPTSIGNFSSLQILLLNGNRFTGNIPSEIGQLISILKLDMRRNNFSGIIPPEIGHCLSLTYLDLSQNQISGPIPVQIAQIHILNYLNLSWNHMNQNLPKEIGFMKSLTSVDFSHNNFSGWIPQIGQFHSSIPLPSLLACPRKIQACFGFESLDLFFDFAVLAIVKTRKDNNVIGRGGAGIVYRGTMPNGEQVAVKKLQGISKGSSHDNGLSAEIQTLGRIRHRNIVRLLAFCSNKETNLLVYEYMPNGSLGEVLHGKRGGHLKWDTRLKIAIEAAKGLSDFGLAKFLQDNGTSECMSAIAGSYGYIAPVVPLKLWGSAVGADNRAKTSWWLERGLDIVQWSKIQTNWSKEGVVKILDERLRNVPEDEAIQTFFVAMLCVQEHSVERPTMREVIQMLAQAKQPNTFHMQ
ncbi:Leucine-rich repeat receptor-like serine/threonine-protein kinase BAM2 [Vitis vinifera]|uniref:Leucine-rich repeat receptor-like serine/threonine-protein kinase BAM2 n=1 Tax=Vitis vinifera TaxID=29760 RepID=A0A438GTM8_VITVI|nr:Leucine-rich repeat receptor-like serine/threonine-protein kinase BAM2 [Vitis vinifera]